MKKLVVGLALIMGFSIFGVYEVGAENEPQQGEKEPKIELTEVQKSELDKLYQEMFNTKKELIKKYVEYGVITQEKADKKMKHMDKYYSKIKENNYVPKWDHRKKHYKHDSNEND
jgi:hypothetical protein